MAFLGTLLTAIVTGLIVTEMNANMDRICLRIIRVAANRLPEHQRDTRFEEWLSHLADVPGPIGKLRHAIGCFAGAAVMQPRPVAAQATLKRAASLFKNLSGGAFETAKTMFRVTSWSVTISTIGAGIFTIWSSHIYEIAINGLSIFFHSVFG